MRKVGSGCSKKKFLILGKEKNIGDERRVL